MPHLNEDVVTYLCHNKKYSGIHDIFFNMIVLCGSEVGGIYFRSMLYVI